MLTECKHTAQTEKNNYSLITNNGTKQLATHLINIQTMGLQAVKHYYSLI